MSTPFDRWAPKLTAATDEASQRALLGELGMWRASRLGDVVAVREATFAMSQLHMSLGQRDAAVHEARSLLSLCDTHPAASREERQAARGFLGSLGEKLPQQRKATRAERPAPKASLNDRLFADAAAGRWGKALRLLRGKGGPKADLMRAWLLVGQTLSRPDEAARLKDLQGLHDMLRGAVGAPKVTPRAGEPEAPAEPVVLDTPLAQLLGRPVPRRREARVKLFERFAADNPGLLDTLAELALKHHVEEAGLKKPAPWLIGTVGRALALGGERSSAAVAELTELECWATTAYSEPQLGALGPVVRTARDAGWQYAGMRRGVLARLEPQDRKVWTLRLVPGDGCERMLATALPSEETFDDGLADKIVSRLVELCPNVALHAPGAGNEEIRALAAAAGVPVLADPAAALGVLGGMAPVKVERRPREERRDSPARTEPKKVERAAKAERGPRPEDVLKDVLASPEPPQDAALVEVLGRLRRLWHAFGAAEGMGLDDERAGQLLEAVDRVAPPGLRLASGIGFGIHTAAAHGEDGRAARALALERYAGPTAPALVSLGVAALASGWTVDRVLRGATRRECKEYPMLDAVGEHLSGLWRLLVSQGDRKGEVWFVGGLPIEGRAGLPQLLLEERPRAVVLPVADSELLGWYGTLRAPEAIGWTGSEAADAVASLS